MWFFSTGSGGRCSVCLIRRHALLFTAGFAEFHAFFKISRAWWQVSELWTAYRLAMNWPTLRRSSHDMCTSTTAVSGFRAIRSRISTTLAGLLVQHRTREDSGSPYLPDSKQLWACICTMCAISTDSGGGRSRTRRGKGSRGRPALAMRRIFVGLHTASLSAAKLTAGVGGLDASSPSRLIGN